jgi:hypothetical protein
MLVEFIGGPLDGKRLNLTHDKDDYLATIIDDETKGTKKYFYRLWTESGVPVLGTDGTKQMCYQPDLS